MVYTDLEEFKRWYIENPIKYPENITIKILITDMQVDHIKELDPNVLSDIKLDGHYALDFSDKVQISNFINRIVDEHEQLFIDTRRTDGVPYGNIK
jgi:hypothetical protein